MGVQPTFRYAESDSYDEAMMQLSSSLREKIAADLAPIMVDQGQNFDVTLEQSQAFFDDTESGLRAGEGAVRVIVQTAGRPDDELLFSVSARSMRRALAAETEGLRKPGKAIQTAHRFDSIDGFVAELTPAEICNLAARNDVIHISLDRATAAMGHDDDEDLDDETGATNVRNSYSSLTGTGVGIAFLDSGVDSSNTALKNSSNISRVKKLVNLVTGETTTNDKHGHGTSVAGAAAGRKNLEISGIATDANVISVRVLNQNGQGLVSDAIRGLDWCVANKTAQNIRVVNLSLGASSVGSFLNDPLCQAVERAVGAGIVVVTAAGNNGRNAQGQEVYGSITSPGNSPLAITVGAVNTRGTAYRSDDTVNNFSSRGPTLGYRMNALGRKQYDFVLKPDLVAPGNKIVTAKAISGRLSIDYPDLAYSDSSYMKISGTSIASGVVAGAAAVLLQANPGLTPGLVKAILQYTAQPLNSANVAQQGAGLLNLDAAVKLAKALKTNASSLQPGDQLALSTTLPSLNTTIVGQPCATSGVIFSNAYNVWSGNELFLRNQMIYKPGALWFGPTIKVNGTPVLVGTVLTGGVRNVTLAIVYNAGRLGPNVLSGGVTLSTGVIIAAGIAIAEGITLSEGIAIAEGITLGEGIAIAEGITIGEGIAVSEGSTTASSNTSVIRGE